MVLSALLAALLLGSAFLVGALALAQWQKFQAANPLEWLFAALTLGILALGWIALALAELGLFSPVALGGVWGVSVIALGLLARRRLTPAPAPSWAGATIPKWELGALAVWLGAASLLFFRPHEYVLGGADAGVYVSLGASIAHSGGIIRQDPLLASFGPTLEPALLRALPPGEYTPYYYLPGFYVPDAPPGRIIPQFYALHPVWLALAYAGGGVFAELYMTGLWALLACLAAYLLARRLWGRPAALLTLGSLSIAGLQVWFARYPTSEMLTQYLFLAGAWAFVIWTTEARGHGVWPALAGAALGQLFLVRIDMLPLLVVPPLVFIWRRWSGRSQAQDSWFYALFGLLVAHSFVHGFWQSAPYFFNQFQFQAYLLRLLRPYGSILIAAAGLALALLIYLERQPARRARLAEGIRRYRLAWSLPLAVLVIGLTLYGYFVRPQMGQTALYDYWYAGGAIPNLDHENLVRLGWYFTPFGIMLAAASVALMILRGDVRRTAFLLGAGLFFAVFYLWRIQNNPHQVYAMRRYVPIVVPFLVISVAYAINWLYARRARFWRGGAAVLAAAWLIALGLSARGLVSQVDYRGLVSQVEQLNATFPPHSIIVYYDPTPVGLGDLFGTPLKFLYGHDVVVIRDPKRLDRAAFAQLIGEWRTAGRALYWVTPDGDFRWPLPGEQPQELLRLPIRVKMLEPTYERRPSQIVDLEWWQKISVIE